MTSYQVAMAVCEAGFHLRHASTTRIAARHAEVDVTLVAARDSDGSWVITTETREPLPRMAMPGFVCAHEVIYLLGQLYGHDRRAAAGLRA